MRDEPHAGPCPPLRQPARVTKRFNEATTADATSGETPPPPVEFEITTEGTLRRPATPYSLGPRDRKNGTAADHRASRPRTHRPLVHADCIYRVLREQGVCSCGARAYIPTAGDGVLTSDVSTRKRRRTRPRSPRSRNSSPSSPPAVTLYRQVRHAQRDPPRPPIAAKDRHKPALSAPSVFRSS